MSWLCNFIPLFELEHKVSITKEILKLIVKFHTSIVAGWSAKSVILLPW